MKLDINCKNYRLDDYTKSLIIKKLDKFDKYFSKEASAKVKLSTIGNNYSMEVAINGNGKIVRSVVTGEDMRANIDVVLPKLERQIVKHRDKFVDRVKKDAFDTPAIYQESESNDSDIAKIVKVKKFDVSVTTVENAAEEMEMLGHDFYVFINGDNNKVCVLYKRSDGDLGLIEPEY